MCLLCVHLFMSMCMYVTVYACDPIKCMLGVCVCTHTCVHECLCLTEENFDVSMHASGESGNLEVAVCLHVSVFKI